MPYGGSAGCRTPALRPRGGGVLRTCLQQVSVTLCCHHAFFLWSPAGLPLRRASQQGSWPRPVVRQLRSRGFRRWEDLRPTCLPSEEPPDPSLGPQMLPLNPKPGSRHPPAPSCGTHKHVVLATELPAILGSPTERQSSPETETETGLGPNGQHEKSWLLWCWLRMQVSMATDSAGQGKGAMGLGAPAAPSPPA